MLDFRLLAGLVALALSSEAFVNVLELSETFERGSSLGRGLRSDSIDEVGEDLAIFKLDLVLAEVVQDGVDASDDTAGIIQGTSLLHVKLIGDGQVTTLSILSLLEELCVDDDSENRLWHERKEIFLEAKDFSEGPLGWQTALLHVVSEDAWVTLERRPVERSVGLLFNHLKIVSLISNFDFN